MADQSMNLGTIFTARMSDSFTQAVRMLREGLNSIGTVSDQLTRRLNNVTQAQKFMGNEVSHLQTVMGNSVTQTQKFQDALAKLGSGRNEAGVNKVHAALTKVEGAIQATATTMRANGKDWAGFEASQDRATKALGLLSNNLKIADGRFISNISSTKASHKAIGELNKSYDQGNISLQQMVAQSQKTATAQTGIVQASEKAVQSVKKTNQAHRESLQHLSASATGWDRLKNAMMITSSYGVAATLIYSVTNALRAGASEIIKYDQALQNLKAITGATDAEIGIMDKTMLSVAATTRYSANEIADGMVLLGQAGLSAAESINSIRAVSELAGGTLEDLKKTTDLMTTTLRAYHLDSMQSGRVADVMANAMNKSKLTLDSLRIAFNYVGSSASMVGLSLEETAASMMVLSDNGMRASTVGTGLRQVLARMMNPTAGVRKAVLEAGLALDDINPKVVGFQTALKNLQTILLDDSGMVNMTKAFEMFQLRGAQSAAVIVRAFTDGSWQKAMDATYDVGSAAEMLEKQSQGLGNRLMNLVSAAKSLAISFGNAGVAGVIGVVIDSLRLLIGAVTAFTDNVIGRVVLQMAVWTGAIYGVIKAWTILSAIFVSSSIYGFFSSLFVGIGAVTTAGEGLLAVLTAIGLSVSTFAIWATIIAGVGLAIYAFANATEKARQEQEKIAETAQQNVLSLKMYQEAIKSAFDAGNSRELESLLQRLKKDHPELAAAVDKNKDSYEGLSAAMNGVINAQAIIGIKATAAEIGLLNEQLQTFKENALGANKGPNFFNFADTAAEEAKRLEAIADQVTSLARQIYDSLSPEKQGKPVTADYLASMGMEPDQIKSSLNQINAEMEGFKNKELIRLDEIKQLYLSKMFLMESTTDYQAYYDNLSIMEQGRVAELIANTEKEIESFRKSFTEAKKYSDDKGSLAAQLYAGEEAIRAAALAKHQADLHKGEDSERESIARQMAFKENYLRASLQAMDKESDAIAAKFEEERAGAEEKGLSIVAIEEQETNAIIALRERREQTVKEFNASRVADEKLLNAELVKNHEETFKQQMTVVSQYYDFKSKQRSDALANELKEIQQASENEVNMAATSGQRIADIQVQNNENAYAVVRDASGKIIAEMGNREASLKAQAEQGADDSYAIVKDASGKIISETGNRNAMLKAQAQQAADDSYAVVRDESGKIIAEIGNRNAEIEAKNAQSSGAQAEAVKKLRSAYEETYLQIALVIDGHVDEAIRAAEEERDETLRIYDEGGAGIVTSTEDRNEVVATANEKFNERVAKIHEEEAAQWTAQLDKVRDRYQTLQEEILKINQAILDNQKSAEDTLFDMQTKNMDDAEKLAAQKARLSETIAKAEAAHEQAMAAETYEAKASFLKQEIELRKEVVAQAKETQLSIKDGEKDVADSVKASEDEAELRRKAAAEEEQSLMAETAEARASHAKQAEEYEIKAQEMAKKSSELAVDGAESIATATATNAEAIATVEDSFQKIDAAYKEMAGTREQESKDNLQQQDALQTKLDKVAKTLTDLAVEKVINIQMNLDQASSDTLAKIQAMKDVEFNVKATITEQDKESVENLGEAIDELESKEVDVDALVSGKDDVDDLYKSIDKLHDKDIHVTIHEKTVQGNRWGGLIENIKRFAFGGHLSGYGGGDIVDAKLEPGEFVVRKEAVRNIGTDFLYAINNMRIGARDMLSNIQAKTGGYIAMPRAVNPFPQLAFAGGGAVPKLSSLQNVGSLNLSINNQETGPIYGEIDVLQKLSQQVKQQNRLRKNR